MVLIVNHGCHCSDESTVIVTDPSPVAYLRVSKASLQPKEHFEPPTIQELRKILRIDEEEVDGMSLWDQESRSILNQVKDSPADDGQRDLQIGQTATSSNSQDNGSESSTTIQFARQGPWFAVSVKVENATGSSLEEEVAMVFDAMLRKSVTQSNVGLVLTHIRRGV